MAAPKLAVEIRITLDTAGNIRVEGPMEQKIVFFGMLEIAKQTAVKFNEDAAKKVQLAPAGLTLPTTAGN